MQKTQNRCLSLQRMQGRTLNLVHAGVIIIYFLGHFAFGTNSLHYWTGSVVRTLESS